MCGGVGLIFLLPSPHPHSGLACLEVGNSLGNLVFAGEYDEARIGKNGREAVEKLGGVVVGEVLLQLIELRPTAFHDEETLFAFVLGQEGKVVGEGQIFILTILP